MSSNSEEEAKKTPVAKLYVPPHLRNRDASRNCALDILSKDLASLSIDSSGVRSVNNSNNESKLQNPSSYDKILQEFDPLIAIEDKGLLIVEKDSQQTRTPCKPAVKKSTLVAAKDEPNLCYEKLQHIIELYNFPDNFDVMHIEAELRSFEKSGYCLKWVDDTHCLVIFPSPREANLALQEMSGILVKARPVSEACRASKWKIANSPGDWAMPYKARPPSDASVANRIISSHLGLRTRSKPSPAALHARQEALDRRKQKKLNQQAMWGDD